MNREQVNGIDWVKMNVTSGFGDLYRGKYGNFDLIRKKPRTSSVIWKLDMSGNEAKWAREVDLSRRHSDNETGPRVFFSSIEKGSEEIVMERYSMDLFDYVDNYLNNLQNEKNKTYSWSQMQQITRNSLVKQELIMACDRLIDKLSTLYVSNQNIPFCFGDFRPENIVVKTESRHAKNEYERSFGVGHIIDMRQIDFDFCAAIDDCNLTKEQYEAVLKMCLTMSPQSEVYDYWFDDNGFMFGDYLRTHFSTLKSALHCIYEKLDSKTKVNLKQQTGLPWTTAYDALITKIGERLHIEEEAGGGERETEAMPEADVDMEDGTTEAMPEADVEMEYGTKMQAEDIPRAMSSVGSMLSLRF